ncbi:hypothetical protein MNB_SM-6-559 [hydrothermal vent metagenome]|uniref:DUF3015 domain-containing protein n=1 Tax=hydrothermal vent metagenome TaxID=652676 RepID=A0A1W1C3D8_9ZZZZ
MKKLLMCSVAALTMVMTLQAKDADFGKIYTECGLGGLIGSTSSDKHIGDILAIITNVTFDLGTTASTSYFSSDNGCYNKKAKTAAFINESYEKLEKEIAMGSGKYLNALAQLSTVGTDISQDTYIQELRSNFAQILNTADYEKLSRYKKVEKLYNIAL